MAPLMPPKADALLARASDYAYSRVMCGDHFPIDVRAGEALAYTLHSKPAFQARLAAARVELSARGLVAQ